MTNGTIFTGDDNTSQATKDAESLVATLVGEGRKYATVEELAKAYINADGHIETLEQENQEFRTKLASAKAIDDVLERISATHLSKPSDGTATGTALSAQDVQKLVEQTVTGLESTKAKNSNLLKADAKLKEVYGEKAVEMFEKAAPTPELKKVYIDLASVDPDKFVSLLVPQGTTNKGTGTDGATSTANFGMATGDRSKTPGTKEYYNAIRKSDPKKYYSQDFQLEMDKAVRSNPSLYFNN